MQRYYLMKPGTHTSDLPKYYQYAVSKVDTIGKLTNGRACYGYADYERELTEQEIEEHGLIQHSEDVRLCEYKPLKGWHEFSERTGKHNYYDYAKPGDRVDEETYNYFLNILPPATMKQGYFQVGEPYSHEIDENGRCRATWATFIQEGDTYYYLGHCFAGETVHRG